jgi:hypothetical protein
MTKAHARVVRTTTIGSTIPVAVVAIIAPRRTAAMSGRRIAASQDRRTDRSASWA